MKRKIYQKPAVKMLNLNTDVVMFIPGGGGSPLDPNPETPSVGGAKEMIEEEGSLNYQEYGSIWDDDEL